MGFGMITAPILTIYFGPIDGILWCNICGLFLNIGLFISKFKDIEWQKFWILTAAGMVGTLSAILLIRSISKAELHLLLGILMIIMVIFSVFALKLPQVSGRIPDLLAGFLGGATSVAVAQSGPIMAAHAQATRWSQKSFAATMQPYFFALNLAVISLKYLFNMASPQMNLWNLQAALILLAIPFGIYFSQFLARIISANTARNIAIIVAGFGSVFVLYQGITGI